MSARDTLAALIERVETATGPDAALDGMIWQAVTPGGSWCQNSDGVWLMRVEDDRTPGATARAYSHPPRYTASLDAAVSLASDWVIASLGDLVADGMPGAVLLVNTDPVKHTTGIGYGTRESGCLARALVAAALRARMESER